MASPTTASQSRSSERQPEVRSRAPRRRGRLAVALVGAVAVLALVGYTGYAVVVGSDDLLHPDQSLDCRTPAFMYGWTYEAVNYDPSSDARLAPRIDAAGHWVCDEPRSPALDEVVSSDGIRLAGWYIPSVDAVGPTGPTVVLVPGRSSNKSEFLRYGVSLHQSYNVVVFDLRGTGQSDAAPVTLGVLEQRDVEAIVDWLASVKHPRWIAVLGTSMGAAAGLAAAATDERIRALVLDSMHARISRSIANGIERDMGLPAFPTQAATFLGAWVRTGVDLSSADPIETITRVPGRPVLLTHGSEDEYNPPADSVLLNLHAALEAGVAADVGICAGAGHSNVVDHCQVEWASWVASFLAAAGR